MKTYWLEKREYRSQSTKNISIQEPHQWHCSAAVTGSIASLARHNSLTRNCLEPSPRLSSSPSGAAARLVARMPTSPTLPYPQQQPLPIGQLASTSGVLYPEERPIYSPITFQDVARRSVANSPTKSLPIRGKLALSLYISLSLSSPTIHGNS